MAVDHLGEIMVNHGKGSKLEHLRLHRTNCSLLIKDCYCPGNAPRAILGYGWPEILSHVFCVKHLCVVIQYYSILEKKIVTSLLNLIPVIRATGEDLLHALKSSLNSAGLSLDNCVIYGWRAHNSVWSESSKSL